MLRLKLQARAPGPGGRAAPAGGPVVRAERPAPRRGAARHPGRRLAARRQHGHRRAGDRRDHRAAGRPVPGRRVREHAARPSLDRARSRTWSAAALALSAGRDESCRRRAGCRGGHPRAPSRRPAGRRPAGRRDDPPHRLAAHRGPHGGGGGRLPCGALVSKVPGDDARPASGNPGARAVRPRGRRAVVGPSRRGGPYPRSGRGRRGRFRRGARTSRLASGISRWWRRCAAGCAALRSWPPRRQRPSRPASSGRPASTRTRRRSSRSPGCTWNATSCARHAGGSSRRRRPRRKPGQADRGGGLPGRGGRCPGRGTRRERPRRSSPGHGPGGPSRPGSSSRLSLAESRACAAAGDIQAALAAAERAGHGTSPEAAVTLAHAWAGRRRRRERKARARARAGGR